MIGDSDKLVTDLEASIAKALDGITVFFTRDMEDAQDATSLESLTRGRYLQSSCAGISRSLQSFRIQVRINQASCTLENNLLICLTTTQLGI